MSNIRFIHLSCVKNHPASRAFLSLARFGELVKYRPIRLTQCCTQFKSPGDKILCEWYFHYNVAFTFK